MSFIFAIQVQWIYAFALSRFFGQQHAPSRWLECLNGSALAAYKLLMRSTSFSVHYLNKGNVDAYEVLLLIKIFKVPQSPRLLPYPHFQNDLAPTSPTMAPESALLQSLGSERKISLLNDIDKLRSYGISQLVSLPQIIVCGDQSSGKSSVLEATSGIAFPRKDNLCTRFATEVILRHASEENVSVAIVPSADRSESEQKKLKDFKHDEVKLDDLASLMEEAKTCMGLDNNSSSDFSKDILRLEISGPQQPHLTIVDLPGIIHSGNKHQTDEDVAIVNNMVAEYMKNERSIILAIVSAKNDYANQVILKRSRDVDPQGKRTLGVITKPDQLSKGSESEQAFINLAKNQEIDFRLGWHVLRNRNYEERNSSSTERDQVEKAFFGQGRWKELAKGTVGIQALRERLSDVLFDQIRSELPSLIEDIQQKADEYQITLSKLGRSRGTNDKQRRFLSNISQEFQIIAKAAVDGSYGHEFFGSPLSADESPRRLRAIVQGLNSGFAEMIRKKGHQREIIDGDFGAGPGEITRSEFLDEIEQLLKISKGRELSGMYNPLLVGDIFRQQSRPWKSLAQSHVKDVWQAVKTFLNMLIGYLADETTSEGLLLKVIMPLLDDKYKNMTKKLEELLEPYQVMHAMTYNHYFTDTIQKVRSNRREAEISRKIRDRTGIKKIDSEGLLYDDINLSGLVASLSSRTEADMNRYACTEILDCMEAYYKVSLFISHKFASFLILRQVAMKCMIDNVAMYAVECCLLAEIKNIFTPSAVLEMSPQLVEEIAAESPKNETLREETQQQLKALQKALEVCKGHASQRPLGTW